MAPTIQRSRIPREVLEIAEELERNGEKAWIVGGCLRDLLLGRQAGDWDVATTARPEKVQKVFRRTIPTGIAHGTVTVLWKGHSFEVTTLRGEGAYTDGRHPDSVFFVDDIVRDLERRDFTVNALAYEAEDQSLVDPYGGLADLDARVIRAVREPLLRFREDGLRVLRAARFCATLEFDLDPATEAAIRPTLDVLARVSRERVRDEWNKAMKAAHPSRAFDIMRRTGILTVVAAELETASDKDFARALRIMDASRDVVVRHAALALALGTGPSAGKRADALLAGLRYSNDERRTVTALVSNAGVGDCASLDRTSTRKILRGVGRALIPRWLELMEAIAVVDHGSVEASRWRASVEREIAAGMVFETKELRIRGDEVAPLVGGPGPAIRKTLEALLEWVDEDPARNDHAELLKRIEVAREAQA